ncbi:hypothetical protein PI124_g19136 [Phytophthora idaei]|nr:hypothetical protein PI125_g20060 [Phytophthora idaei]KAG3134870.1 hypothetical protein PI126_g18509 [Phytophthora idaei]KAG3235836.1 hypothetical protein PI124_g19136 [Phytophthora idaei]
MGVRLAAHPEAELHRRRQFVRFTRLKASEEQGLSLFPDLDFVPCPVYAALALMTQAAPCLGLLDNLLALPVQVTVFLSPATLLEVLDHHALGAAAATTGSAAAEKTPAVSSHANRVLDWITATACATDKVVAL